eukprot:25463-Pelagomonas_calceolata.AAC.1
MKEGGAHTHGDTRMINTCSVCSTCLVCSTCNAAPALMKGGASGAQCEHKKGVDAQVDEGRVLLGCIDLSGWWRSGGVVCVECNEFLVTQFMLKWRVIEIPGILLHAAFG